jgi:predicted lipase
MKWIPIALCLIGCVAGYDETVSKRLVYYSAAAFCEVNTLKNWNCGAACQAVPGVTSFTQVADATLTNFGYVAYNPSQNEVVVAYRGSHNIENWINDMDAVKINYQRTGSPAGAQVHGGFFRVYQSLSSQTDSAVKALLNANPTASIVVTGHSLGAAVATFSAVDLKLGYPTHNIKFYTFGSPRPGN